MSKSKYPAPEHYAIATSTWRRHVSTFNVEGEEPIEAAVAWLQHLEVTDPELHARFMADAEAWMARESARIQEVEVEEDDDTPTLVPSNTPAWTAWTH